MVRRAKLDNAGEVHEIDPADELDNTFAANPAGNASDETGEVEASEEDTEQDTADQEAAGVAPSPGSSATTAPPAGNNNPPSMSPKMQYNALKRTVTALGAQLGASKTSMIALAEAITEAAQGGVINDQQAGEIYDKFREGVVAKSTYEDAGVVPDEAAMERIANVGESKSRDQQLSKLRRFIHLGNKYESDAYDLVVKARNMHIDLLRQALGSAETKSGVKPGSTYNILVDVARAQLQKHKDAVDAAKKAGQKMTGLAPVLTDAEISAVMTQPVKDTAPMTGEEKLLAAYITAKAAYKGSAQRNPVPSDELQNGIDWLRQALATTAPALLKEHEDKLAKADADAAQAASDKARREQEKLDKANQPKAPKPTKAERQAGLAANAAA